MQMILPRTLRITNPLLQYPLRLLYKLPMQINRIPIHSAHRIVFPENVIRRLLIILVHQRAMPLAFFRQLVRGAAIAAFVGLVGLMRRGISARQSLCGMVVVVVFGMWEQGERVVCDLADEALGWMRPTLARQEERLPASWRARSRRRSYSASVELDWGWWLKAI